MPNSPNAIDQNISIYLCNRLLEHQNSFKKDGSLIAITYQYVFKLYTYYLLFQFTSIHMKLGSSSPCRFLENHPCDDCEYNNGATTIKWEVLEEGLEMV